MAINFTINDQPYTVNPTDHEADKTLNAFIREDAQLPGTKFMCLEGGCGACLCVIKGRHPSTNEFKTWATNSCLTLLNSCDGWDITTIEGLGNKKKGYHPIQERLAHLNGSQCGYCSPGMVMNMYGLIESKPDGKLTMEEIENSFGGNLCRCTGYRPILDAMKSFATDYVDIDYPKDDIEDIGIKKMCLNSKQSCKMSCNNCTALKRFLFKDGTEWYTARLLKDVFDVFEKIKNKQYMLVAGNTAHGVYRRSNDIEVFIDINNVKELHESKFEGDVLEFGGSLSLTETMDILSKVAKNSGFEYCQQIYNHLDLVANVPVRNMGTLAGNLCTKHQYPEFPSDVFICFEGADAKFEILCDPTKVVSVSPKDFLKLDMKKCILKKITLRKFDNQKYFFNSYKIMPRAQNAHAYINAAFQLHVENDIISNARICFGGVNPTFIHAENTENYLKNKCLTTNNDVIQKSLEILNNELKPDWNLPDASPEYRKLLACGLFYKFILNIIPKEKLQKKYLSGGTLLKRDLSSGMQTYDTNKTVYPITKPIAKIEGLVQCSGEAFYANDLPMQPKQLWAAFVHATETNVKIGSIDSSKALKIPGVVGFFSAKDIPGINSFTDTTFFVFPENEEIFASDEIKYFAQPVGVIVAESMKIAQNAANLVKILYVKLSNDTKIMPTIQDVIENKAWDRCFDAGIQSKENVINSEVNLPTKSKNIQGSFEIGSQYHFTMEPLTTVCIPKEDGIEVYSATQSIDLTQKMIAKVLNVKANSISVQVRRLGGGYGIKISRVNQIACACALPCFKLNRPVRFVQSLESIMSSIGKRFACRSDYEMEVNDDGKILKLKNTFWEDSGCSLNESPVEFLSIYCAKNCYNSEGWKIDGKLVKTDAPSHTWCRAPGALEGIAMIENMMEHIARETNKDPVDVRMANIPKTNKMYNLLPDFVKSIEYSARKKEIENFNKENRWKKRGLGIALMQYPIEYFGMHSVLMSVYNGDGTVTISHGGIEMGQGINTKVAQVAAYNLGIPIDFIKIHPTDSFTTANSTMTGGGVGSESVCYATRKACQTLIERMKPVRDTMKDAKWEDVVKKCSDQGILLTVSECHKPGDMKTYEVHGIGCSEIEIDVLTGNLIIKRVDIMEDVGESLNPAVDIGQIEGAFIMGIGYWLTEQLVFNRQNGELLTTRTWNYKVPGVKDIPIDFRINFLKNSTDNVGFMRSKATGEPSLCLSVSVLFALRNAIDSARNNANIQEKWYHLGAPTMPEHTLLACGNTLKDYKLL